MKEETSELKRSCADRKRGWQEKRRAWLSWYQLTTTERRNLAVLALLLALGLVGRLVLNPGP